MTFRILKRKVTIQRFTDLIVPACVPVPVFKSKDGHGHARGHDLWPKLYGKLEALEKLLKKVCEPKRTQITDVCPLRSDDELD
jgi:hypothetical protein